MIYEVDTHTHTIASGHAYSTLREMAQAAANAGLKCVSITDHAPSIPGSAKKLHFSNYGVIPDTLYGVEIWMGVELNILDFDGSLDLNDRILKRQRITLAGFHSQCYQAGTRSENTHAALKAMQNPYLDILCHPDDSDTPLDYELLVKAAKETGVLLEVNENSFRMPYLRSNCEENLRMMLQLCKELNTPIVIGSDAHFDTYVGEHFRAEKFLDQQNFPKDLVLNQSVNELRAFLRSRKQINKGVKPC